MAIILGSRLDAFLHWMERTGWHKLQNLVLVAILCIVMLLAVRTVAKAVRRAVDDGNDDVTTDAERRAETLGAVLNNTARVVVVALFFVMVLKECGVDVGPLVAGAGIAGVALGFGAQSLVKDVISGFFILMENQFGVGDIVSVDDKHVGTVERMTLRVTQIRDAEGRAHYLPNGSIVRVVVLSKEFAKAMVDVDVAVQEDVDRVMDILRTVGTEICEAMPGIVISPTDVKGIESMDATGCTIRTFTTTAPGSQWEVARELRRRILLRFRQENVSMPLRQQIVWNRGFPSDSDI
jgi:small-conductance mechanosensitive channel